MHTQTLFYSLTKKCHKLPLYRIFHDTRIKQKVLEILLEQKTDPTFLTLLNTFATQIEFQLISIGKNYTTLRKIPLAISFYFAEDLIVLGVSL